MILSARARNVPEIKLSSHPRELGSSYSSHRLPGLGPYPSWHLYTETETHRNRISLRLLVLRWCLPIIGPALRNLAVHTRNEPSWVNSRFWFGVFFGWLDGPGWAVHLPTRSPEGMAAEAPVSGERAAGKKRPHYGEGPGSVLFQPQTGEVPEGKGPDDDDITADEEHDYNEADENGHHSSREAFEHEHAPMLIGRAGALKGGSSPVFD